MAVKTWHILAGVGLFIGIAGGGSILLEKFDSSTGKEPEQAGATKSAGGDYYDQALDAGMDSAVAAQSASSPEDWANVAESWSKAIGLLKVVSENDPSYEAAQSKITEYEANRAVAVERQTQASAAKDEKPKTEPVATNAIDLYQSQIKEVDPEGTFISGVRLWDLDDEDETAEIVVTAVFLAQNKTVRLEIVTALFERWVITRSSSTARVRFVTQSGKHVGGNGPIGRLYVDD